MASFLIANSFMAASQPPPVTVALSGVFGSISLVAWICVIVSPAFVWAVSSVMVAEILTFALLH